MINYIFANNYKSFVNFRVDFERQNLLIGKNGCGKSNVFLLIVSIRDLLLGKEHALNIGFSKMTRTRWMKSEIQTFELGLSDASHRYVYSLEVKQDEDIGMSVIESEKVECDGKVYYQMTGRNAVMYDDSQKGTTVLSDPSASGVSYIPMDGAHEVLCGFKKQISNIILCVPNPKNMQDTVTNDIYIPMTDFSNIASSYVGITQLDPEIYNDLAAKLRDIEPGFQKVRIYVENYAKYIVFDYKFNDVQCTYVLSELSDGERMIFALYLLLYGYIKNGFTVLLDEPDNYLSLREIQPWCMDLEDCFEEQGQCLLISHHPEIIDYMADTKGIWLSRLKSGESKIIDEPAIGDNKDLLTFSQMISRGLLDEAE